MLFPSSARTLPTDDPSAKKEKKQKKETEIQKDAFKTPFAASLPKVELPCPSRHPPGAIHGALRAAPPLHSRSPPKSDIYIASLNVQRLEALPVSHFARRRVQRFFIISVVHEMQ